MVATEILLKHLRQAESDLGRELQRCEQNLGPSVGEGTRT